MFKTLITSTLFAMAALMAVPAQALSLTHCDSGMYYQATAPGDGFLVYVQPNNEDVSVIFFTNIEDAPFWGIATTTATNEGWLNFQTTDKTPEGPAGPPVYSDSEVWAQFAQDQNGNLVATIRNVWFTSYTLTKLVDFAKCK